MKSTYEKALTMLTTCVVMDAVDQARSAGTEITPEMVDAILVKVQDDLLESVQARVLTAIK
jgi:hypothetical protein